VKIQDSRIVNVFGSLKNPLVTSSEVHSFERSKTIGSTSRTFPKAMLYLLNRDHVAAEAVVALTRLRTSIIERIIAALSSWSPEPVHASLFGSVAVQRPPRPATSTSWS
jgi:hypothetical protein